MNTHEVLPGDFTRNADFSLPTERLKRTISASVGAENTHFIEATRSPPRCSAPSLAQNIFLVGYAYQLGGLPLSAEAILKAIELNGEAVAMNQSAFQWAARAPPIRIRSPPWWGRSRPPATPAACRRTWMR